MRFCGESRVLPSGWGLLLASLSAAAMDGPTHLLHAPPSLRKSVSVDSFVGVRQQQAGTQSQPAPSTSTSRNNSNNRRGHDSEEEWYGIADSGDITFVRGRSRATSLTQTDSDLDPYLDDSDYERSVDLNRLRSASTGSRAVKPRSSNGKISQSKPSSSKQAVQPGDLLLPARTSQKSTPPVPPIPTTPPSTSKNQHSPRRARSGSFNNNRAFSMTIDTNDLPVSTTLIVDGIFLRFHTLS